MTEHEEFRLTFPIVFNYTVPIKENADSNDDQMGAGVLIEVAGSLLVASAAHCIKDKPAVLENNFSLPAESKIRILRRGTHPTLDIGFLELERNGAIPILNRGDCSLEMICLEPLPANGMVHIVGFPAVARTLNNSELTVVKKGFGTQFTHAIADHFFFSYPEVGWSWDDGKNDWKQTPLDKTPHGYSGGGCWGFVQPNPGELFTQDKHIRLYAIQTAWDKVERYVKCVPIAFWLSWVGSCCPDLRPAIASRFPDLAE
ncbi:MAG TPA: hypothetical protein VMM76_18855 [Pirellulaceae bacterium]|nr:hypothetical protein [Pirellulaceae bacterium]